MFVYRVLVTKLEQVGAKGPISRALTHVGPKGQNRDSTSMEGVEQWNSGKGGPCRLARVNLPGIGSQRN